MTGTTLGTSPAGRGFDDATNLVYTTLFARTDPTPILSGIDARLIEGESKLKAGDIAGMMTILNALRAAPQNLGVDHTTPAMAALPTPATQAAAINLYFREKAFWTFARGQRLGDLRRLIRRTGVRADGSDTFPTGTFFKGGSYGPDVNFPVDLERAEQPTVQGMHRTAKPELQLRDGCSAGDAGSGVPASVSRGSQPQRVRQCAVRGIFRRLE